jgi:hypothetical protein
LLAVVEYLLEHFKFEATKLPIGDDEEIAAPAGRIDEAERAELVLKLLQLRGAARS